MIKKEPKEPTSMVRQRVNSGRNIESIIALLLFSMLMLSLRNTFGIVLGTLTSLICIGIAIYNFLTSKEPFLKLRAKYIVGMVLLAIIGYYASFRIVNGDITLIRSLASALITATSISAVFAVTIYEKIKELTLKHEGRYQKDIIDISVRLATYPLLISVVAIFSAVLALVVSDTNFLFSVFLINVTITFVLATLIMSVELLKEDLMRELNYYG